MNKTYPLSSLEYELIMKYLESLDPDMSVQDAIDKLLIDNVSF